MKPLVPGNAYLRDAWLTAFAWAWADRLRSEGSHEGIANKSREDLLVNLAGHDADSQVTITRDTLLGAA